MGKAVLISIQPRWCEKIAFRDKSLEIRKTKPNIPVPFKCYIYQTRRKWLYKILEKFSSFAWARAVMEGQGKVIGEFVCDSIFEIVANYEIHDELPGSPIESWLEWDDAPDEYETTDAIEKATCLSIGEISRYIGSGSVCYCWHISNLVIYDKPKPLSKFYRICNEWEKDGFTQKCRRCSYYERSDADMCYVCCVEGEFPVLRAPQSWCYVEEI